MDKLTQVAIAIRNVVVKEPVNNWAETPNQAEWLEMAQAAIEAMREPTAEMLQELWVCYG